MDSGRDGVHIIGEDQADNRDDKPLASSCSGYGKTASLVSESFQIPTFGSRGPVLVQNYRSYKSRHCKHYFTEAGCPFGDNCLYIHDDDVITRGNSAIIVGTGSRGPYRCEPPSLAPSAARPLSAASTSTMKSLNWKTRICSRWQRTGYCPYGSRCNFAHGEAELQPLGGGTVVRSVNPYNQQLTVSNVAAASGSTAAHVVVASGSSANHAGVSGQVSGASQRPIPTWKLPKKISGIYGDWIDEDE